jgi:hypothetical protein
MPYQKTATQNEPVELLCVLEGFDVVDVDSIHITH